MAGSSESRAGVTGTMAAPPHAAVAEVLAAVDAQPSAASYARAARQLAAHTELEPVRVALLASFTIEPLVPYLVVEAGRRGFAAVCHVGPFNSVVQELLSAESGTVAHAPDVLIVARLLEDVAPSLAFDYLALSADEVQARIDAIIDELGAALASFRRRSPAAVVLHNFGPPRYPALGVIDGVTAGSQTVAIRALNARLATLAAGMPGVCVLDYERLVGDVGGRRWWDDKMWALGRAPLSVDALPALARRQAAYLQALRRPARKALVVDLDDTLWGGVVGEVGSSGIKIGAEYPGAVFHDLQRALRLLKQRGVLLAINSKNNLADVEDAFSRNPQMPLTLNDFSAVRVNWQPKPENMRAIADELNIGVDSLVFLDDNPAERALMRQALPEVLTLELPAAPLNYAGVVLDCGAFDRLTVTREDAARADMYRAQQSRRALADSGLTMDEFLASLEMRVGIAAADAASFTRVVDLLHKTNQFNLTTRRHTAAAVHAMMASPTHGVFTVRVIDRFGDNGIVGLVIVEAVEHAARIDTLLLSCRVIGRRIETALLWQVQQWARDHGLTTLLGDYIPTAKNAPAADFFARHRFEPLPADGSTGTRWRLDLTRGGVDWPACLTPLTLEEAPVA